jgi:hypothetical protein
MPDILMRSNTTGQLVRVNSTPEGFASGQTYYDIAPEWDVRGIVEFSDITAINEFLSLNNGNVSPVGDPPIESVYVVPAGLIFYLENIFCVYRLPQLDKEQTQKKQITAFIRNGNGPWMALASLWLYRKDPCDTANLLPLFTSDQALRLAPGKQIGFSVQNEQPNPPQPASGAPQDSINLVLHGYLQRPTNPNLGR